MIRLLILIYITSQAYSLHEPIGWIDASTVDWASLLSYRSPDGWRTNCITSKGNCWTHRVYVTRYQADDGHGVANWSPENKYLVLDRGTLLSTASGIKKELKLQFLNYTNAAISWILASGDDLPLHTLVSSGWLNDGSVVYPCRAFFRPEDSYEENYLVLGRYVKGTGDKRSGGCQIYAPGQVLTSSTFQNFVTIKIFEVMQINLFGLNQAAKRFVYTSKEYCPGRRCDPATVRS